MVFWLVYNGVKNMNYKIIGPSIRAFANANTKMSQMFNSLEGLRGRIFPSPHNLSVNSFSPNASKALFIGPSSHVRGNVILDEECAIHFNSIVECIPKTGSEQVFIGKRTTIKDLVSIKAQKGGSTIIGSHCCVEGNSSIVNSVIEDNVFIAPGCRVINSKILKGAYLAPGTVVENATVGEEEVVCKNPFEVLRKISPAESEYVSVKVVENREISEIIAHFTEKNCTEQQMDRDLLMFGEEDPNTVEDEINTYIRMLEDKKLPVTKNDLSMSTYRDWMLEDLENRRLFGYKDNEFNPSRNDMRSEEIFGAYQEDLQKHIDLHEKSEERKGKLVEPDFSYDTDKQDYRKNIEKKNDESNKF